jgi:hypothetical protein
MKKILLISVLILFLTGCSMEYNVTYNQSNIISDKIYIEELVERFTESEPDDWGILVASKIHTINIRNEFFEELATYEITLKSTYDNLSNYTNDEYIKKYVGDITLTKGEESTFKVNFNNALKYNLYGSEEIPPYIDSLKINITIPYKVNKSNATSSNGNVYTWELTPESKIDNITFTYKNPEITVDTKEKSFDILMILTGILLVVFIIIIKTKNKKNNAL